MTDAAERIRSFVERVNALKERFREDMAALVDEMTAEDVDPATIRKVAALAAMDEEKREERDTLLDLYRSAAGIDPPMAQAGWRQTNADWQAADLFNDGASVRDVAKALKISTGKAHKLRVRWRAFGLFTRSRPDEHREHFDPNTGEIHESGAPLPAAPVAPGPAEGTAAAPDTDPPAVCPIREDGRPDAIRTSDPGTSTAGGPVLSPTAAAIGLPTFLRRVKVPA